MEPDDATGGPLSQMTLRDWFAGQALAGLLSWSPPDASMQYHADEAARQAYEYADEMLKLRSPN